MTAGNGRAADVRRRAGTGEHPMNGTFDLDAAVAAAEGEGKPFRFTDHGIEYEVPRQSDWPLTVFGALARGDLEFALRALLGDEQWDRLSPGFTLGRLDVLFTRIAEDSGMTLPNSGSALRLDLTPR